MKKGAVSAAIKTVKSFYNYKEGIFEAKNCRGDPDHAVTIMGFKKTKKDGEHWIGMIFLAFNNVNKTIKNFEF